MDFEFKDGDYIVWDKLSAWQKQYVSEHLPFVESFSISVKGINSGIADRFIYCTDWCFGTNNTFGSGSSDDETSLRELSFNQIFGCDKEVVEVGENILEHIDNSGKKYPLWVTFDISQDELGSCHLTDGKDYKVLDTSHGGDCYLIKDDSEREQSYNKRYFDKHILMNRKCEESLELVYKYPEQIKYGCYGVIDKNKLSAWQKDFIAENVTWEYDYSKDSIEDPTYTHFNIGGEDKVWFMYTESDDDIELSFNDIFFPRKENQ